MGLLRSRYFIRLSWMIGLGGSQGGSFGRCCVAMFKRALKLGYTHEPLVLDGDPERTDAHLLMIHIVFFNLKTWLLGTHHGIC